MAHRFEMLKTPKISMLLPKPLVVGTGPYRNQGRTIGLATFFLSVIVGPPHVVYVRPALNPYRKQLFHHLC